MASSVRTVSSGFSTCPRKAVDMAPYARADLNPLRTAAQFRGFERGDEGCQRTRTCWLVQFDVPLDFVSPVYAIKKTIVVRPVRVFVIDGRFANLEVDRKKFPSGNFHGDSQKIVRQDTVFVHGFWNLLSQDLAIVHCTF